MIAIVLLLILVVVVLVVGIVHLKGRADRYRQNDKPEPMRKHDYIIRKKNASHGGPHPHIVYDKYTGKGGEKRFRAVAVSHEWKSRNKKNPHELKKGLDPFHRGKKAFVIHEIVDDEAVKFRKGNKYMNYSVHPKDRNRLRETIERWEREPKDYREEFPRDARTRRIISSQKRRAKAKGKRRGTKKGT